MENNDAVKRILKAKSPCVCECVGEGIEGGVF